MKNFLSLGSWLLVVLVMLLLGACAKPGSGVTKNYEIDMETDTGSNVVILVLDADVDSNTAVRQDAKADARTQVDAALSQPGKVAEAAGVVEGLLEAGNVPEKKTTPPAKTTPTAVVKPAGDITENGVYWGRHNGDRATWYFAKNMTDYPDVISLTVVGCVSNVQVKTTEVDDDGNPRFVVGGYVIKQSDVPGRAMAVVAPQDCDATVARIEG